MDSLRQEVIALEMHWSSMGDYLEGLILLEYRKRRSVLPIVGNALSVLFGTITEVDLETIRRKWVAIGDSQLTLAGQTRSSLSILNVRRIDLAKKGQTSNRQVKNVLDIKDELGQVTCSMSVKLWGLGGFVAQFMQLLMAINRLKQTPQPLQLSLEHVMAQLDMLSLGHLSPSIITLGHLRDILFKIQAALPHSLWLPADPNLGLWRYYILMLLSDILFVPKFLFPR